MSARAWVAIREDEIAAELMGVEVTKQKVVAFALSAVFAGLAGAIFAHWEGFVTPESFTFWGVGASCVRGCSRWNGKHHRCYSGGAMHRDGAGGAAQRVGKLFCQCALSSLRTLADFDGDLPAAGLLWPSRRRTLELRPMEPEDSPQETLYDAEQK